MTGNGVEPQLSSECAGPLALAIVLSGALFLEGRGMSVVTTRMQAGMLDT